MLLARDLQAQWGPLHVMDPTPELLPSEKAEKHIKCCRSAYFSGIVCYNNNSFQYFQPEGCS